MTGIRLVAETGADFPYDRVESFLTALHDVELEPLDLPAIVAAGERIGWPREAITEHWEMMRRGKCLSFWQGSEPGLSGTLYEESVLFSFSSGEHEDACRPVIAQMARQLRLAINQE